MACVSQAPSILFLRQPHSRLSTTRHI